MTPTKPVSQFRVRYLIQDTGEIAHLYPMSREDALELAQQLVFDGVKDVQIVEETGQSSTMA